MKLLVALVSVARDHLGAHRGCAGTHFSVADVAIRPEFCRPAGTRHSGRENVSERA